ncbi:MAG: DUF4837 family protein [Calditrichia bacterium]
MKKSNLWVQAVLFLILTLLIANSCTTRQDSFGEDDRIIVFADSLDWQDYEDPLNEVFGQYVRTPLMERKYLLEWVPFRRFDHYKNYKNIFFLGRLNSQQPVSRDIKDLLDEEAIQGVRSGKYFFIPKEEPWAQNQYVMFLVAPDKDAMIQKIIDLGDLIFNRFQDYYYQRLEKQMFKRMEQEDLEDYIAHNFPFKIRVQHDYFIADDSKKENYVWLRRLPPDRSLLISWMPLSQDFELSPRWAVQKRNQQAEKLFSGDVIVEDETQAFSTEFKNHPAIRLEGTWRNDSLMVGGPFRNISFVDRKNGRIYMIDYYVQAVGQRKKPYMDQLQVIVNTFKPLDKPLKKED